MKRQRLEQGTHFRRIGQAVQGGAVVAEVVHFLTERMVAAHAAGIADVVLDPGFGFGKNTTHNHTLLHALDRVVAVGAPVLVGLSRKRMIKYVLGIGPDDALNGTTVLHAVSLMKGADILRVHDVKAAVEAVKLVTKVQSYE